MKPKKSLGQNFLTDKDILAGVAATLKPKSGETVIEIGPGHGELTEQLITNYLSLITRLIIIEKDRRLCELLKQKFGQNPNITVIAGDALRVLPELVKSDRLSVVSYKLVGNIPYYITGHLLRVLSELEPKPTNIVLLVQKEVAERICSAPPRMNLLAASVQFWAEPQLVMHVGRKHFHPAPKVDSAVIRITPRPKTRIEPSVFYPFLKQLFKQPRKTILNNLGQKRRPAGTRDDWAEKLAHLGITPDARPQGLSLADIEGLARGINSEKSS